MTESNDSELLSEERNLMLLLLISLKAYSVENDELFSVDHDTVNELIEEYLEANTSVPELLMSNENGRMVIDVKMREPSDQEVEEYVLRDPQEEEEVEDE